MLQSRMAYILLHKDTLQYCMECVCVFVISPMLCGSKFNLTINQFH